MVHNELYERIAMLCLKKKPFFMSNKFLLTAVAVLVFGLSIQGYSQSNIPTIHQPFPDIELPTLDGGKTSLSDLLGEKNVVLVTYRGWVGFW